jgi:transposase
MFDPAKLEKRSNMEKQSLELLLAQGLSLEQIGKRFGKEASTVSYWMKKHGLEAVNRDKHSGKGGIEREVLAALVESGASIAKIALALGRSTATIRHWLAKYELETHSTVQRRIGRSAREAGRVLIQRQCRHHGMTEFWLEGRGTYRCVRCRHEAVARRRRKVKQILVEEADGACAICGYHRYIGGLHFHHCDRAEKSFSVSLDGVARSLERARQEARKCVLLCSNCHAEVEAGIASIPA